MEARRFIFATFLICAQTSQLRRKDCASLRAELSNINILCPRARDHTRPHKCRSCTRPRANWPTCARPLSRYCCRASRQRIPPRRSGGSACGGRGYASSTSPSRIDAPIRAHVRRRRDAPVEKPTARLSCEAIYLLQTTTTCRVAQSKGSRISQPRRTAYATENSNAAKAKFRRVLLLPLLDGGRAINQNRGRASMLAPAGSVRMLRSLAQREEEIRNKSASSRNHFECHLTRSSPAVLTK